MIKLMLAGLAAAAGALMPMLSMASDYPSKPVTLIAGFAAGGPTDVMARAFAQQLAAELGVPIVVENRPGADSLLASQAVRNAKPDGYTIYLASSAHAINPSLFKDAKFKVRDDFTPISTIGEVPNVVAIPTDLPARTLKEFIDYAKARDGQLNYATTASITYLQTALMLKSAGLNLQRIPYKGAAPAAVALMSGDVQFMMSGIGPMVPQVQSQKIRALAVTSAKRSALLPDVPTAIEAGLPGFTSTVWYALLAPANVPPDIVKRLNESTRAALQNPELIAKLTAQGVEQQGSTPEELSQFLAAEEAKWMATVDELGARQQ
ncbi:tripartite tricarboxylate transporter substrate binding protein [Bordetella bronchiseptica]|uniref:tripartite tricarboxylate transporter substrate binding protein n=1 Tax=Bordetella bronchiseptica TaxID=518 RepID=UPI00028F7BC7|nr:tripartite tricarboxylate transporter substrate binding protein [Bordetella bronchiseptica]KCV32993.1 tripartite tricarboxylate transporter family receptor [Bordetella bronchiseptica 00-P-2730]AZW29611.1 tripartite tricarboxylate transporter substrate binding protein [Bordetella bronchiseptica]KCV45811.1 tripartite tricarboxylate transporter family receptor [Bordetella bronchiseptica 345]KDC38725.1 tripartite tricarboxylate transporter family receptor [Bordetella bronchiseptica GA96-01]KDC6